MEKILKNKKVSIINSYIGIKISRYEISEYLDEVSYLHRYYFTNRYDRDKDLDYHITISFSKVFDSLKNKLFDIKLLGIGEVYKNNEHTLFIVCEKDFHITIAFKNKDIHKIKKDKSTLIKKAFKKAFL
jgi:hypothetical protein